VIHIDETSGMESNYLKEEVQLERRSLEDLKNHRGAYSSARLHNMLLL
jgi:hypothetical protein